MIAEPKYLDQYTAPSFQINKVDLTFDIQDDKTDVTSFLTMTRTNPSSEDLILNADHMEILSVQLNGSDASWDYKDQLLTICSVPDQFDLKIENRIIPHENKALEGLYQSGNIFCTQCEPEGFRRITPFLDRPDAMTTFKVTIKADKSKYPVLLSNGNPKESGDLDNGRHFAIWEDPFKKPAYLFALVAGDLGSISDTFTTKSGRQIPLTIYVDKGNENRCHWAMDSLKRSMKWDEDVFNLEYDLDVFNIVAVDAFNMGAMENKGLNIFNSSAVLADPKSETDDNFQNIEGIVAHEYFHNWTGNRVTCRDWFQLTLKEGLTVFRDQEFSSDMNSRAVCRIADVAILKDHQFPEDSGPNAHPIRPASYIEINNFYTPTVYQKGAEIIRMIHTLVGATNFKKGIALYFERHDGQAVTCEDFISAMADASNRNLGAFKNWYRQAGTPHVSIKRVNKSKNQNSVTLEITQSCPHVEKAPATDPFVIPLKIGIVGQDGQDLPIVIEGDNTPATTCRTLEINQPSQTFTFLNIPADAVFSYNRGFSAPITLESDLTFEEDLFLLSEDNDPFNRWNAGQRLSTKILNQLIDQFQNDKAPSIDQRLVDAFIAVLNDSSIDEAFKAEILSLPSITRLTESMKVIDYDAAYNAHKFLRQSIAQSAEKLLTSIYQSMQDAGTFEINARGFGRRRLKNLCLSFLMTLENKEVYDLCFNHFESASNMTDEYHALCLISDSEHPNRENVITRFYDKWKNESLVINKWIMAQAIAKQSNIIDTLNAIEKDPAYDRFNPNKVRSLVGGFAANVTCFHDISGKGYAWFADRILEVDSFNPTLSGRLAKSFGKYAKLDAKRQSLMRKELERILAKEELSKDVYEVVSNTLKSTKNAVAT